ncbi:efflux RND transporter periplasmic adaptor subunit [Hydrogenovibrio kuenenii]|uniref:efflux RND transporter periplasmic adaptor subunit n=1 Tax=Hydrogenovibrio kuenenii TaxID=63658 RepID=UPI000467909C|nr:efflux RND transporter periplasmic adaptor subunit [Hydrogenovibrio kuenenii]
MSALQTTQVKTIHMKTTNLRRHTLGAAMLLMTASMTTLFTSTPTQANEPLVFSSQQITALGIATTPVKKITHYPSETYPAEAVVPLSQTHLVTTPISGLITKIDHVHGPIKKGEVIAEILSPDLLNAQKNYLNTLSDLSTAKASLARALKLTQNGVVSVKNKQKAQSDVNKLSQIKRQQRQDLVMMGMSESSIQKLEKTQKQQPAIIHVVAPVTGELFNLQAKVGQRLMANQALISIGIVNPIVVDMRLPVSKLQSVDEGMQTLLLTPDNQIVSKGVIAHISSFVDPMTQAVEIHNKFDNSDSKIHPGQLFQVEFVHQVGADENVYQVPASAIGNFDERDVVFLMRQRQITVQPIKILLQQEGVMVFKTTNPIDESQQVVTQSTSAVKAALLASSEAPAGE